MLTNRVNAELFLCSSISFPDEQQECLFPLNRTEAGLGVWSPAWEFNDLQ